MQNFATTKLLFIKNCLKTIMLQPITNYFETFLPIETNLDYYHEKMDMHVASCAVE